MNDGNVELVLAKAQRDRAVACAALSFFIVLALAFSNFGYEPQTERARRAVQEHKAILAQAQLVLQRNASELSQDEAALESLRRVVHP